MGRLEYLLDRVKEDYMNETQTVVAADDFMEELRSFPGGEKVDLCIQCGTCTASCPNADRMDYAPRQVIAMLRAGMFDEVLRSNSMWFCASCYLCTVRCPRDIKPTELMHSLECMSARHGLSTKRTQTPAMYRAFVASINSNGRVHEFDFMFKFLLRHPLSALKMLPLALSLLSHGRLAFRGTRIKGKKQMTAILGKAHSIGGAT